LVAARRAGARGQDWSAQRGSIAKRIAAEGSNLRALDEDLARVFPDSASVRVELRAVQAMRVAIAPAPARPRRRRAA
jgi:hypothetical protein